MKLESCWGNWVSAKCLNSLNAALTIILSSQGYSLGKHNNIYHLSHSAL